jgi:hypothetical protein
MRNKLKGELINKLTDSTNIEDENENDCKDSLILGKEDDKDILLKFKYGTPEQTTCMYLSTFKRHTINNLCDVFTKWVAVTEGFDESETEIGTGTRPLYGSNDNMNKLFDDMYIDQLYWKLNLGFTTHIQYSTIKDIEKIISLHETPSKPVIINLITNNTETGYYKKSNEFRIGIYRIGNIYGTSGVSQVHGQNEPHLIIKVDENKHNLNEVQSFTLDIINTITLGNNLNDVLSAINLDKQISKIEITNIDEKRIIIKSYIKIIKENSNNICSIIEDMFSFNVIGLIKIYKQYFVYIDTNLKNLFDNALEYINDFELPMDEKYNEYKKTITERIVDTETIINEINPESYNVKSLYENTTDLKKLNVYKRKSDDFYYGMIVKLKKTMANITDQIIKNDYMRIDDTLSTIIKKHYNKHKNDIFKIGNLDLINYLLSINNEFRSILSYDSNSNSDSNSDSDTGYNSELEDEETQDNENVNIRDMMTSDYDNSPPLTPQSNQQMTSLSSPISPGDIGNFSEMNIGELDTGNLSPIMPHSPPQSPPPIRGNNLFGDSPSSPQSPPPIRGNNLFGDSPSPPPPPIRGNNLFGDSPSPPPPPIRGNNLFGDSPPPSPPQTPENGSNTGGNQTKTIKRLSKTRKHKKTKRLPKTRKHKKPKGVSKKLPKTRKHKKTKRLPKTRKHKKT